MLCVVFVLLNVVKLESHEMVEYAVRYFDLKSEVWMHLSSIHDSYCVLRKTMLGFFMYVKCWWEWYAQFMFLVDLISHDLNEVDEHTATAVKP
jgi:hypothetical protein